jgi:hypothetical protein
MHRQRTGLVARTPARVRPVAETLHRYGVVATYELHDRALSNRDSRRRYSAQAPQLTDEQRRIVETVRKDGYATTSLEDLGVAGDLRDAVERQGEAFVSETERGLAAENGNAELRRRPGKEFLVRAHSFDGVTLSLDHPWFKACVSPHLLNVANAYLEMCSKLSYVDLWYTVPQTESSERVASQLWHYDFDDRHLLKAFLYLADVDEVTGPFEYVAGSQPGGAYRHVRPWKPMGYGRVPEEDVTSAVPDDAIRTFTAPRGTLIFCNTSGLHRGGFATSRPRVLATATYCSPASLSALSLRNFEVDPSQLSELSREGRYAVT